MAGLLVWMSDTEILRAKVHGGLSLSIPQMKKIYASEQHQERKPLASIQTLEVICLECGTTKTFQDVEPLTFPVECDACSKPYWDEGVAAAKTVYFVQKDATKFWKEIGQWVRSR